MSGKRDDEAIAWAREHKSGKLRTLHLPTCQVFVSVEEAAKNVYVCALPVNRIFIAVSLETGEQGLILSHSVRVRDKSTVASRKEQV